MMSHKMVSTAQELIHVSTVARFLGEHGLGTLYFYMEEHRVTLKSLVEDIPSSTHPRLSSRQFKKCTDAVFPT